MGWHIYYEPPVNQDELKTYQYSLVDDFIATYKESKVDPAIVMCVLQYIVDRIYAFDDMKFGIENVTGKMIKEICDSIHPAYKTDLKDFQINIQTSVSTFLPSFPGNDCNIQIVLYVRGMKWRMWRDTENILGKEPGRGFLVTVNSDSSTEE